MRTPQNSHAFYRSHRRSVVLPLAHNGFTLVELLVVIAIIAILASLMMPTLKHSLEMGRRAGCSGNLRQIGFSMQAYFNDNNNRILHSSYNSAESMGYLANSSAFQNWYADQLGSTPNPEDPTKIYEATRFYTNQVIVCPSLQPKKMATPNSQGRIYNYYRTTYGFFMFGPKDHSVTTGRVEDVFRKKNSAAFQGNGPIMAGDRCNITSAGNNGGFDETNHKGVDYGGGSGIPEGGNTVAIDCSVRWMMYIPSASIIPNAYVINGGAIGSHLAIPSGSCYAKTDSSGNLSTSQPLWIIGRTSTPF